MIRILLALSLLTLATGCKKDQPVKPVIEAQKQPINGPTPAGTDADHKRIEAMDLAVKIDAALATYERGEKALPELQGKTRKAEAYIDRGTPPKAKKIVITANDGKGLVETTDFYYDERGLLQFARAPDGLFVFQMESLALWLDRDQKVKRGLNPSLTKARVDSLMADNRATLVMFGLR